MRLRVDSIRAELVVSRLQRAFLGRDGLLAAQDDLVENQIPEGVQALSREHALFLFYTVANDHGMKSTRLYARAKELFQNEREIFEPCKVLSRYHSPDDPHLLQATGKFLGTRYPSATARGWYLNSNRLEEQFGGDPRNLFSRYNDAQELLKQITNFIGYGPKTGGLLLRAVIGLGFAQPEAVEKVLLPVDIHDSRISFITGIVSAPHNKNPDDDFYYSFVREIQQILLDACNDLGLAWPDIDRALWLIGSRGCAKLRCGQCPIQDLCEIGRSMPQSLPLQAS